MTPLRTDAPALRHAVAMVEGQLRTLRAVSTDWAQYAARTEEVVDAVTAELGAVWGDASGNAVVVAMVGVRASSTAGSIQALRNWCSAALAKAAQASEARAG